MNCMKSSDRAISSTELHSILPERGTESNRENSLGDYDDLHHCFSIRRMCYCGFSIKKNRPANLVDRTINVTLTGGSEATGEVYIRSYLRPFMRSSFIFT